MKSFEQWQPNGIPDLEPAAWNALRHKGSACVIAGPGAGKTEFLAQKAAYLLENNICPVPFRILAISFKKDAAENLAARVKKRCKPGRASRFDSYTFDAFTKGLVDRFQRALPPKWRLPESYEIATNFKDEDYRSFLEGQRDSIPKFQYEIAAIHVTDFKNQLLATHKLTNDKPSTIEEYLCRIWFSGLLKKLSPDFQFINRLAEWIIRSVPTVKKAIQQTYPYVFVDEFQDTTFSQYDFLCSLLYGSDTTITTVGDNKQRIMVWAGAKLDAFNQFSQDFSASEFNLLMNYRSSPGLVEIQRYVARLLDPNHSQVRSGVTPTISQDIAKIWQFSSAQSEYVHIASWIVKDKALRNLKPTDYAILVRQKADAFFDEMAPIFRSKELTLRNEVRRYGKLALQDIVSDEIFLFIADVLNLIIQKKAPAAWVRATEFLKMAFGEENQSQSLEILLNDVLLPLIIDSIEFKEVLNDLINKMLNFIGIETIKGAFPHHSFGNNLEILLESTKEYLKDCLSESQGDPSNFLRIIYGTDHVHLLTIHKSKGLEYDTILFVGLDDTSWWNYSQSNPEGNATFFVALSRAKQRIIFTHSKGNKLRQRVSPLYKILKEAGVMDIDFTAPHIA